MITGVSATYLDSKVKDVTLPSGRVADRAMPQAPRWSVSWHLSYALPIGGGTLTPSTEWRYDGGSFFSTFNGPIDREPGHVVGNARLSYGVANWTVTAFVNNITNKRYRVYDLDNGLFFGSAQATYARPRWYGVSGSYAF